MRLVWAHLLPGKASPCAHLPALRVPSPSKPAVATVVDLYRNLHTGDTIITNTTGAVTGYVEIEVTCDAHEAWLSDKASLFIQGRTISHTVPTQAYSEQTKTGSVETTTLVHDLLLARFQPLPGRGPGRRPH